MSGTKDKQPSRKKRIVAVPKYPGGGAAFKRFLSDNLTYPEEALQKSIEGDVFISFRVNDDGVITEAHILKGIGYGCDEEALRIVRLLKYEKVRNRGLRVHASMKTKIPFRIKKSNSSVQFVYQSAIPKEVEKKTEIPQKEDTVYSYTIKFRQSPPAKNDQGT